MLSGPKFTEFFRQTRQETLSITKFFDFRYLYPFRRYSIRAKFSMFLAPNSFGGTGPKFLYWGYKTEHASEHVEKFCGDQPKDLKDLMLKKKLL